MEISEGKVLNFIPGAKPPSSIRRISCSENFKKPLKKHVAHPVVLILFFDKVSFKHFTSYKKDKWKKLIADVLQNWCS